MFSIDSFHHSRQVVVLVVDISHLSPVQSRMLEGILVRRGGKTPALAGLSCEDVFNCGVIMGS